MATLEILATDQSTGNPIVGADVWVFLMERETAQAGRGSRPRRLNGTTDGSGLCSMAVELAAGERVRTLAFVRAPGHEEWRGPGLGPRSSGARAREESPTLANGETIRLTAALERGLTLRGSVTDEERRPVAKAHIGLVMAAPMSCTWPHAMSLGLDAHWPPPVRTDERGFFEWLTFPLRLVRADRSFHYVMRVDHDEFATALVHRVETRPADGDGVIHLVVQLAAGTRLQGRVLGADGSPARGAEVAVTAEPHPDQPVCTRIEKSVRTDDDGRYQIRGLWKSRQTVKVEASGHAPWSGEIDLTAGASTMPEVALVVGADLAGQVLSPDGTPIPDIDVYASMPDMKVFRRTRSGADGRFRLEGLPPTGRVDVRASILGHTEIDLPSPPITLRVPAARNELRVAVVADEDGSPIPGRAIVGVLGSGFSTSMISAPDGTFAPKSLPPGKYTLRAEVPDRVPTSVAVELPEQGHLEPVAIRVPRGGVVRGTVRDLRGQALAGVQFATIDTRHSWQRPAETDGTGTYEVRGLGSWAYLVFTAPELALCANVLRSTGTAEAPVTLDVRMGEGATVTGRVTRGDGSPSVGANVVVSYPDLRKVPFELPASLTGDDGRFELRHVPPGDYVVTCGTTRASIRSAHGAAVEISLAVD